ncbi:MAG TPA: alpha/beta hydrolase [Solirubrobacter sp.]|nr:alpha/beta hydrolase [Solirubrobacter sp.]
MKLRLYHHPDGARIAYRQAGAGPPLALLHSQGLTHREFEPVVDELARRHRVVLPDLPLHGASEDRPSHPYTPDWLTDVLAGFLTETCGPRPVLAAHGFGAQLALRAIADRKLTPARLVLLPSPLHTRPRRLAPRVLSAGAIPGVDRILARAAPRAVRPGRLTATGATGARDLVRHALTDLTGTRVRALAKAARAWPRQAQPDVLDRLDCPVLLLWADEDPVHPLAIAEDALERLPDAQLRVLERTGFLIAYDDPVGLARELLAFCG